MSVDELIVRSLQGETSLAEERELQAWRQTSFANERRYREVARLWSLSTGIAPVLDTRAPSAAELVALVKSRQPVQKPPATVTRRRNVAWMARWAVAACLVLGLGLGLTVGWRGPAARDAAFGAAEFVTGAGEMVTARLSDGSVVRLAPESRLRIMADGAKREVWLDGHAFFAVAHDEGRPFTVRTRAGDALVLGTRFDVNVQDEGVQVVVVEGRVALGASGATVEVGAGEMSRVVAGEIAKVERVDDLDAVLHWMDGFLVFQSTPLPEVARDLERVYGIRILLPDSVLNQRTVSAWFSGQSVEEVLTVVCRVVDAHCSTQDSVVSIEP